MMAVRGPALALCLAASILGLTAPATTALAAETPSCSSFQVDLLQVVRPASGVSLLTKWKAEADAAKDGYGFSSDEGVLADVAAARGTGLAAVYRLYKNGDFVWATEGEDADALVGDGYQRQFIDFYAATADTDCLSPITRYKRGSVHRISAGDPAELLADGWVKEKTAFYAKMDTSEPEPEPDPGQPTDSTDTKFSIAVLPDTQNEFTSSGDTRFVNRANWLGRNKSSLDLRYSVQVGDLVNWGQAVPAQFTKASSDVKALEAVTPWAPVVGNHDTGAVCVGGSACLGQNANIAVRNTTGFNQAFPVSRFPNLRGTFEAGKVDNSYQIVSAGGVQWMFLSLELWPRPAAVEWAKDVVAANPRANVIVATHHYLDPNGTISGSNGGYGSTSPDYLYKNLIRVYPNIKMVLSGHVGNAAERTDTGINGNKILSLLQCYHSSTNPVRLVEIDTASGSVDSKVFAPKADIYFPGDATSTDGMTFVK